MRSIIKPLQIVRKSSEDVENGIVMPPHQRNNSPPTSPPSGEEIRTSMGMSYRRSTTAAAIASHNSHDEFDSNVILSSSQSLNRVLNPSSPSRTPSSPSKTPRHPPAIVEQRVKQRKIWNTIHAVKKFLVKYKLSTLCFVASIVTIGTIHNLALRSLLLSDEHPISSSSRTSRLDKQVRGNNYRKVRISATTNSFASSSQTTENSRSMLRQFDKGRHPGLRDLRRVRGLHHHHRRAGGY